MTKDELYVLLQTGGYECRIKGRDVALRTCTFCGNEKWNLGLDPEKGLYHCWACKAGGRVEVLLQQLTGQAFHIPVQPRDPMAVRAPVQTATPFRMAPVATVPSAAHYLSRRALGTTEAAVYGIQVCIDPTHQLYGRIVIPALDFWTAVPVGWVGRSYTGGRPKYLSTLPRNVVTGWRVRSRVAPVVVVEGHFDGIAVHRAGYHAAVLSGQGSREEVQRLAAFPAPGVDVVIMLDADAVSRATELYWLAKQVREAVRWVALPTDTDPATLSVPDLQRLVGGGS